MERGDIVARKSYGCDIFFRVMGKKGFNKYILSGINYRLGVEAAGEDLVPVPIKNVRNLRRIFNDEIGEKIKTILENREKAQDGCHHFPGKVLHVDADGEYLNLCLTNYRKLLVPAVGENIEEEEQPLKITGLLKKHMPDILIITGHDSLSDSGDRCNINKYKSSGYFVDAVRAARLFNPSKDGLAIVAGACQSYYEALMEAGANAASSPKRVLIHALDPLFVAEKIAYTPADKMLSISEMLENTITSKEGLGGFQTRGGLRIGSPMEKDYL